MGKEMQGVTHLMHHCYNFFFHLCTCGSPKASSTYVAAPKPPCFLHLCTCGSPKASQLPPLMYMWQPQSHPASSTYVHVAAPKLPCFLHLCTCGSPKAALLPPLMYMWQPQSHPASSTYVHVAAPKPPCFLHLKKCVSLRVCELKVKEEVSNGEGDARCHPFDASLL